MSNIPMKIHEYLQFALKITDDPNSVTAEERDAMCDRIAAEYGEGFIVFLEKLLHKAGTENQEHADQLLAYAAARPPKPLTDEMRQFMVKEAKDTIAMVGKKRKR